MKKSFYPLLIVLLLSFTATGKCYYCQQINTKPYGCEKITETISQGDYNLVCEGAGDQTCKFSDGTCPDGITISEVELVIRQQIKAGNLSGRRLFNNGHYSWEALNEYNFSYIITEL